MGKKGSKKSGPKEDPNNRLVCENRRARRNYDLGDTYEAGLELRGSEVKSLREGKAHLNEAYVKLIRNEAFLIGAHIGPYPQAGYFNHTPDRTRKLLLHRSEIDKLQVRVEQRGLVLVPLRMYFKNGIAKLKIAIGKGRTHEDKREVVKKRESEREMRRALRRRNR